MKKFLFLVGLSLISSAIISTNDLADAIAKAAPGDTIEIKAGTYSKVPYGLRSGTEGKPITIKAAKGAKVIFTGTQSSCIFDTYGISYVNIEGPFELKNAYCGAKLMNSRYVKVSGLTVHDVQYHAIVVSGHYNTIENNEAYNCVLENKYTTQSREYGWSQCMAVWGTSWGVMSTNIAFKNNKIHEAYGEGLDFLECDTCSAIGNEITNGFSMNIYIDASRNILVDGNTLRVNTDSYNTKWGRACGVGMAPESGGISIDNITIQNNVMIGTRMGIYFFTMGNDASYNKIKILHNTLWNVFVTPIWFRAPANSPVGCEMKNNFIFHTGEIEFAPKSSWSLGYNYFYNTYNLPGIYYDSTSKSAQTLDLNGIFNNNGNCNYWDQNLPAECLRPSKNPGYFKLFHTGTKPTNVVEKDFSGCERSTRTPSIGAFEYSEGCGEEVEPPTDVPDETDSTTPAPTPAPTEYNIKFKINYCTPGGQHVSVVGSHCSWNVGTCPAMTHEGNCSWTTILKKGNSLNFNYKFVIASGSSASRWESDPNRVLNGANLVKAVEKSANGKYENCNYSLSGNTITLECFWR